MMQAICMALSKYRDPRCLKSVILLDQILHKSWACLSKNGQTGYETYESRFFSCHEHFLEVSLKSDDSHVIYLKNSIFWDQIWPNLGQKHGHAQARMGKLVMKLISLNSFHIKNISWKFHRNLKNLISDILERVYFGTKYDLIWDQIMDMPGQEWTNMLSNSSLSALFIPRSLP